MEIVKQWSLDLVETLDVSTMITLYQVCSRGRDLRDQDRDMGGRGQDRGHLNQVSRPCRQSRTSKTETWAAKTKTEAVKIRSRGRPRDQGCSSRPPSLVDTEAYSRQNNDYEVFECPNPERPIITILLLIKQSMRPHQAEHGSPVQKFNPDPEVLYQILQTLNIQERKIR